jgi:hypothetical protein
MTSGDMDVRAQVMGHEGGINPRVMQTLMAAKTEGNLWAELSVECYNRPNVTVEMTSAGGLRIAFPFNREHDEPKFEAFLSREEVLVYINDVRIPINEVMATEWEGSADVLVNTTAPSFTLLTLDTTASVW